ncbi:phosphomannomutase/phosphoglucomutase [Cellvibrio japonicus]|uniref:phosphomannomutase n=1 Tax=Cellvibrio japonicus (strain Ueda107) TaxID=498211 RepID=B3PG70_CELJU|nr:phosphomannomutase/phosphoglucomutase [Cellvibrio japonicus]ACE86337.1 phosphomannomutase AlgC [Cellvibrio japonicus Ueda107]QEI13742.1 phosphomannomutase/phosphoglucomutase [Cellvibrio japonicus]QEI17316.1 phosphomannomutase/phosphoglucomutase [Cellvibrio japonicus]QEI20893.1 phosphomannomutase/phosphoglucomutase [Cellvibrio japonicus]
MDNKPDSPEKIKSESKAALRAQEASKRKAALQRKILLSLGAIALLASAVISWWLHGQLVVTKQQERLNQLTQMEADNRKMLLESYLRTQTQTVDRLAANQDFIDSLTPEHPSNTPEQRDTLTRQWLRATPGALSVRLFELHSAELDRNAEYPIRFAEMDLIRRAETRQTIQPELVQINDRWQINWARPIAVDNSSDPLGSLFIVIDASELLNLFQGGDKRLGEIQLIQQFAGSAPLIVLKQGTGNAGPSVQVQVAGSALQLKFTPSSELVAMSAELPSLWIMISALITAALLALALLASKFLVRLELGKAPQEPALSDLVPAHKPASSASEESVANPLFHKQDILDIAVIDEDEDVLGLGGSRGKKTSGLTNTQMSEDDIPRDIFRSYDIRGLVGSQLTPELALKIGQAIGSEALDQGEQSLIVARDGRTHSANLTQALIKGILKSGCNVINIGVVPTPLMYFASFQFEDTRSGVMVTASHNPKEYNGFKVVINNEALADEAVLDLRARIIGQRLHQGLGEEFPRDIIPAYIERIFSDVALAGNVSLVIDAGNAVTGLVAPQLFEELGCDVTPLFCDLDGEFPNHNPDPTEEKNLSALIAKVQETGADMGVAFDGDGDRLVVVTPKGDIIWPDRMLMLFARDILARHPGADVLFDVKCSRQLNQVISSYGGRPIMWKTGHSPMKAKMVETGALIGGEYSGHIFIKDRWYGFDDGLYAMARLLEIITLRDQKIDDIFASFPPMVITPELKIPSSDRNKFALIEKLQAQGDFQNGAITTIDGLRVDFPKGWGLVRASNTSPALTLRFEAESQEMLVKIQQLFKRELLKVDSSLALPF